MSLSFWFLCHHLKKQQLQTLQFLQKMILDYHLEDSIQSAKCSKHENLSHQLIPHQFTRLCKIHYNHKLDLKYRLGYYILQFHYSTHMSMIFLKNQESNSILHKDLFTLLYVQFTAHQIFHFYIPHTSKMSSRLFRIYLDSRKHIK